MCQELRKKIWEARAPGEGQLTWALRAEQSQARSRPWPPPAQAASARPCGSASRSSCRYNAPAEPRRRRFQGERGLSPERDGSDANAGSSARAREGERRVQKERQPQRSDTARSHRTAARTSPLTTVSPNPSLRSCKCWQAVSRTSTKLHSRTRLKVVINDAQQASHRDRRGGAAASCSLQRGWCTPAGQCCTGVSVCAARSRERSERWDPL